ncbi:MAG: ASKHA domain-containing protein [Nocardioidaceae bacterium]
MTESAWTGSAWTEPPQLDEGPEPQRLPAPDRDQYMREGLIEAPAAPEELGAPAHAGVGRVRLSFLPADREVRIPPGVSVFDAASWNGIAIDSTCGGHGTCKKCKVQVVGGSVPVSRLDVRSFSAAELAAGWRLACLAQATSDLRVEIPPLVTRPKAATVGVGRQVILRPAVQKRYVELAEPTLTDQRTDLARLRDAIDDLELTADLHALRRLPSVLRTADYKVTAVVVDDVLIDVEPGDTTARRHAIAFDLGTTTVVATLLDTTTGTPVAVQSMLNRQQPFGGDVITRISATMMDPQALGRLTELAHATLDELARAVCAEGGVDPAEVYEIALAGNATMTALALGIDPEPLGVAPFVLSSAATPALRATDLGVTVHPAARAMVFPALGAYVGGDIVAGMLATGMDRDKRIRLFIDVGTNCEIVLGDGERILSTAAPAGPAFEGGSIRCGMRAAEGAIETVRLDDDIALQVIGDREPVGLCGSGLVDAVAELVRVGLLDRTGRFVSDEAARAVAPRLADRLTVVGAERVFVLHHPSWGGAPGGMPDPAESVYLSQRDVRELQFAKAAISTGWSLLLAELGVDPGDVQQVLLAGSFGSYLSPGNAVRIGLVPKLPVLRIVSAGNVAGEGAKMALLSLRERTGAATLLKEVRYVELSDRSDFNDRFVDQLAFPS